jgi:Asp-tRNA(Asn)/Glu-tRNA(Gln) amidotransferase A subunit family amidase
VLTIGTETGGSIMCPSSINGVVGIKPTVGSGRPGSFPYRTQIPPAHDATLRRGDSP